MNHLFVAALCERRAALPSRRSRWCSYCLVLERADLDRSGQKRSIGVLEIGAAYLVILVKVVNGPSLPIFGYGSPVDDFQKRAIPFCLRRECLRVLSTAEMTP